MAAATVTVWRYRLSWDGTTIKRRRLLGRNRSWRVYECSDGSRRRTNGEWGEATAAEAVRSLVLMRLCGARQDLDRRDWIQRTVQAIKAVEAGITALGVCTE